MSRHRGRSSSVTSRFFKRISRRLILGLVVLVVGWVKYKDTNANADGDEAHEGGTSGESVEFHQPSASKGQRGAELSSVSVSSSKFEVLENCSIIDHYSNDGDSFHVKTPKGDHEFRLYYVDAPESKARKYRDGNTNYKRIAEQGAEMGGLDQKQTTEVGGEAKLFVKKLLRGEKFRVATVWEGVYGPQRKYAFILVPYEGQERYLHELLVARGLGRIHTKPHTLPDNTSSSRHKDKLRKLEKFAKQKGYGAWGL